MNTKTLQKATGSTPLVRLEKIFPDQEIYAKIEGANPAGGSIKDRAGSNMINRAIERGDLTKEKTILEATSGNMGISLASIGTSLGFKVKIVMSEAMSEERKQILRSLGAELVLTDKNLGTAGAIAKAKELVADSPDEYWFANQFENEDNVEAYLQYGEEILAEMPEIDYLVAGVGTGGTIMGLAKYFEKHSPNTKIVAIIPPKGFNVQGIQNPYDDFMPKIVDDSYFSEKVFIENEEAFANTKKLAQVEGIFAGLSSGGAITVAEKIKNGKVLVILPDRGDKYLSTGVFA